jgi:hypothetical protein
MITKGDIRERMQGLLKAKTAQQCSRAGAIIACQVVDMMSQADGKT